MYCNLYKDFFLLLNTMIVELSEELTKVENEIYDRYVNKTEQEQQYDNRYITGRIITNLTTEPTEKEFLQIKRNLLKRLEPISECYIDRIVLSHKYFSRDAVYFSNHQWDMVASIFTLGLIIPFILPGIMHDSYTYYNSNDYYYIEYCIYIRPKNVTDLTLDMLNLNEDVIPTIKFIKHPNMSGLLWSDVTPVDYGGCGIPIPEHKELYDYCKRLDIKFKWMPNDQVITNYKRDQSDYKRDQSDYKRDQVVLLNGETNTDCNCDRQ